MRLTRSGDYAVRCLLYLALDPGRGVVGRKEIAEVMNIPAQYLGKVAQTLARAGLIGIRQGARGGYELARAPGEISLLQVVEAVDGEIFLNDCLHQLDVCERRPVCAVHRVWGRARKQLRDMLGGISLAALVEEESRTAGKVFGECPATHGQTLEGKGE